ncbi:MAG: hypothetical protein B9S34_14030 [Opitutia bacterium Tous-C1TDCM]|nr:MAG: hypothetical protein B9S34_14030 [Opitutae bacterium Tous-C1TDCM]
MIPILRLSFLTAGLFAVAAVASAAIERTVEKTFPVSGAGLLRVETQGGAIEVDPTGGSAVKVVLRQKIRADTDAEADELLKKIELTLEQNGNDVTVISKYPSKTGFSWNGNPVRIDIVVEVPAAFATQLKTSGGNITVGDLTGKLDVRTSGGSIKLGNLGGTADARTSGGNIVLASAAAAVNLDTSGGNIAVGRVAGSAKLETSGGDIRIDAASGSLQARTSGGSIRAALVGPLSADSSLGTSGGSVRVTVDPKAAFRLDASTSGGSVDADGLTITLEGSSRSRSKLAGTVNGGGPVLKLRSSGGSILVRTN